MKPFLTLAALLGLGALSYGLAVGLQAEGQATPSGSRARQLGAPDGQVAITITSDTLASDSASETAPRILHFFGAYVDPVLGLVGTELQCFGTLEAPKVAAELPQSVVMELGNTRATITPKEQSWARVMSEADVVVTYTPIE